MRKLTPKQYAESLYQAIYEVSGSELTKRINNFLALVKQKRDLKKLDKIYNKFIEVYQREKGILEAEVVSARPLSSVVKEEIEAWLKKITHREPKMNLLTDESLLGGVVMKFGYTIIDASLANCLNNLKKSLLR